LYVFDDFVKNKVGIAVCIHIWVLYSVPLVFIYIFGQYHAYFSEFKDKTEMKEKTEELIFKELNSCESNMQELSHSIKRPNLRIMGTEEAEEDPMHSV
jgi:hypothetical protein